MNARIKAVRESAGLSQALFGNRIGITRSSVSKLESGENNPSEQTIRLICREFGVSYLWLTTGEDPMYVPQESISLAKMEKIMEGHNPYVKAIFMELADMPEEWWEQAVAMLRRIDGQKK